MTSTSPSPPPDAPDAPGDPSPDRLFSSSFVRLLFVQMLFGLSYSTFLLLPKYLRLELGATATEIGRVSGAATIAAAIVAPFVGSLSLRFSRRKVLVVALGFEALGAFGFCIASEVGPFVYLLRALQGIAWVMVFNVTATMAADVVPQSRMAQAIGYLGTAMLATNALAPAVAEPASARVGYVPVFLVAGCLVAASLVNLIPLRVEGPKGPDVSHTREERQALWSLPTLSIHYGSLLLGAGIGAMFTYVQPYAIERGATVVGPFFFGYVGAAVFVRVGFARLADSVGPARVLLFAQMIYALTVGAAAFLEPSWLLFLGIGLGVSHGFAYPALTAAGFAGVPRTLRGHFMSGYTFAFNFGYALTVMTLGPVVDRFGYASLFLTTSLLIASGVPITYFTHCAPRHRPTLRAS